MTATTHRALTESGLGQAARRLRDPLLFVAFPLAFAAMMASAGIEARWDVGFDFRGTLWEPARAVLDGGPVYPEPTHSSVVVGNPAVYPPLFVLLTVPLATLASATAAWVWLVVLGAVVVASMWLLGVRDWRCHVVALLSPVVLQGLIWGNLTLALLLPLALAWRYRDRAVVVGLSVGAAIAAKLFVAPLLAWLLFTRRFRAAAVAAGSAIALVLIPWTVIGFDGLEGYPALMRELQHVYAVRSASLATVFGAIGLSAAAATALAAAVGLVVIGIALRLVGRPDGDRRAFALVVAACIVASPIAWPNYSALLLVPIAVTWPRLSAVWLFGYMSWLTELLPKPREVVPEPCCRPDDVTPQVWALSHAVPAPWYAAGMTGVVLAVAASCAVVRHGSIRPASAVKRRRLHLPANSTDEVAWP
jgi:hypothetical protein